MTRSRTAHKVKDLITVYANLCWSWWREPPVLAWLVRNAKELTAEYDRNPELQVSVCWKCFFDPKYEFRILHERSQHKFLRNVLTVLNIPQCSELVSCALFKWLFLNGSTSCDVLLLIESIKCCRKWISNYFFFLFLYCLINAKYLLVQQAHVNEMGTVGRALFQTLPGKVLRHLQVIKPMASLLMDGVCTDLTYVYRAT